MTDIETNSITYDKVVLEVKQMDVYSTDLPGLDDVGEIITESHKGTVSYDPNQDRREKYLRV